MGGAGCGCIRRRRRWLPSRLAFFGATHTGSLQKKGQRSLDSWKSRWFALKAFDQAQSNGAALAAPPTPPEPVLQYYDRTPDLPHPWLSLNLAESKLRLYPSDLQLGWLLPDGMAIRAEVESLEVLNVWASASRALGAYVEDERTATLLASLN